MGNNKKYYVMCIIMPPKSKVELSPNYNEIVDLLLSGHSGRYVSDYLLNQYGEKISYRALNTYKKNKLNVKSAAKKKIIEKEKKKILDKKVKSNENFKKEITREAQAEISVEAASTHIIKNYERADELIESAVRIDIEKALEDYKNSPDFDEGKYVDLILKYKKLGLDSMKYQTDLLEDNTLNVNVTNEEELFDEAEIMRILNEESEL